MAPPLLVPRDDPFAKRSTEYSALPLGAWLLYPSVFLGGVYDSNPSQSSRDSDKKSSWGGRLVPSLLAEATDGISKSTFYGMADARAYTNDGGADAVAARTGFIQRYQPMLDLVFNAQADYARQKDLFSTFGIDHSVTTLNPTGVGLIPVVNPIAYNQFSGSASAQKNFGGAFLSLGGSVVDIVYDHSPTQAQSANGVTYAGFSRGGFWFNPYLYAYVEGLLDERRYSTDQFNSSGYRSVGGIGSDQIGLFRGEIYAGYQSERFEFGPLGTVTGTVLGAKLYYFPLRELTFSAAVNEAIGVSLLAAIPTFVGIVGSPTRTTTTLIHASYVPLKGWGVSARFGYIQTDYLETVRRDKAWTVGATMTYSVWRSFGLTLDYQHIQLSSNVILQSFTRDVLTLGGTYKY